jgi:hypothetical protein
MGIPKAFAAGLPEANSKPEFPSKGVIPSEATNLLCLNADARLRLGATSIENFVKA